jgi:hypothetical protein
MIKIYLIKLISYIIRFNKCDFFKSKRNHLKYMSQRDQLEFTFQLAEEWRDNDRKGCDTPYLIIISNIVKLNTKSLLTK